MFEDVSKKGSLATFISIVKGFLMLILGAFVFFSIMFVIGTVMNKISNLSGAGIFGICGPYGPAESIWLQIVVLILGVASSIWVAIAIVRRVGTRIM